MLGDFGTDTVLNPPSTNFDAVLGEFDPGVPSSPLAAAPLGRPSA
jgi:hypothetical protein